MSTSSAGTVVRAGHLRKLKTMKKKFFVLRAETPDCSARLEYYESEKKFRSGASPRRVLPLKSCYNITRRLDLKQKHVIALFTREEQFCVVAENEQELHEWLTSVLKHHRNEDASDELLHPIQHVWQVNVQKKGLGASKNIQGLYNLCLTDQTLTLVKIKSLNNVISDLGIPEKVEYSLKNIRRCGDSECFFYMEVGRQTATGCGELWMHTDDANIAQSMHSTIYHAMRNCAKAHEAERDHIVMKGSAEGTLPARRQTYSDGRGRAGLGNERGLCIESCLKTCVSAEDSAAAIATNNAENQPPNSIPLTQEKKESTRIIKHHRTVSLPTGCPFQEPLKIVHERTRSAPLTGDEVDRVVLDKSVVHSSCKTVNGTDVFVKKTQWTRRASTGTRLSKLSPAHSKNAAPLRSRCDSLPSRASSSMHEAAAAHVTDGPESRDETDAEWHRTPRIPEEPDFCDNVRDMFGPLRAPIHHSRTSSMGVDDVELGYLSMQPDHPHTNINDKSNYLPMSGPCGDTSGYLPMDNSHSMVQDTHGYLPMAMEGLQSPHSGSVCSGTPSTDPRFSEYQLEPAMSHILEERPPRAYSVGSRPAPRPDPPRHRAYSVGARHRPPPKHQPTVSSAPLLPRSSAEDLMELDFSNNSPSSTKVVIARTPPAPGFHHPLPQSAPKPVDEYVQMFNTGYVTMKLRDTPAAPAPAPAPAPSVPKTQTGTSATSHSSHPTLSRSPPTDGYVEMSYSRGTRPIDITWPVDIPTTPRQIVSPDHQHQRDRDNTPLGSQTLFPFSPESPGDVVEELTHHPLTTVREISEECGRKSPEVSSSPSYVKLAYKSLAVKTPEQDDVACNPTATKQLAREPTDRVDTQATVILAQVTAPARFSVSDPPPASPAAPLAAPPAAPLTPGVPIPLNYAALDLEPRRTNTTPAPTAYTQIDFVRSEKLAADGN